VTARRKALLAYLAALITAPFVGLLALLGLLASGETKYYEMDWAARMELIALVVVTAWLALVAFAVRFGIDSARITRLQRAAVRARGADG
jgi:hypothetical protein